MAVAFAKLSGTSLIRDELSAFNARAALEIIVGIDEQGTSVEALQELLDCVKSPNTVWIAHNASIPSKTFHPKLFAFRSPSAARILVGSSNFTRGGLFENYESSAVIDLDVSRPEDQAQILAIDNSLNNWRNPPDGICIPLDPGILASLESDGKILRESQISALRRSRGRAPARDPVVRFPSVVEPRRKRLKRTSGTAAVPPSRGGLSATPLPSYVQTLHRTDVGTGQTTPGAQRRSPEIFVPWRALQANKSFWGRFSPVSGKSHIKNRPITFWMDGSLHDGMLMINTKKTDLRLRSEVIRSVGKEGDILELGPSTGADYEIRVHRQGSASHAIASSHCKQVAPAPSRRKWGFY